jgi:hypothetical protein
MEDSMIRTALALALMSTAALAAPGAPVPPGTVLRTEPAIALKGGHYELSTDQGGFALGYHNKYKEIEATGLEVRVKDICASACTMVLRNPKACAERAALFGFHQVWTKDGDNYEYSDRGTRILWSYYPETVKAKLGQLTPQMVWIKGRELLPKCK